jgi:hypothetical protein
MQDRWLTQISIRFSHRNGVGPRAGIAAHLAGGTDLGGDIAESDANAWPPPAPQPVPEIRRSEINEINQITGWDEV